MPRQPKSRRQSFLALVENMENRELLTGAIVEMYPGSMHQSVIEFGGDNLEVIISGFSSTALDINNKPIDWNADGVPDLLNIGTGYVRNADTFSFASNFINPLITTTGGFVLTNLNKSGSYPGFDPGENTAALDWNDDGYTDFINLRPDFNSFTGFQYYIFQNDGKGSFFNAVEGTLPANELVNPFLNYLIMKDFNNDGAPDLLAPQGRFGGDFFLYNGTLVNGKWDGHFDQNFQKFTTGLNGVLNDYPQAADVNGDNKLDIILPNSNGAGVYINNGTGGFTTNPSLVLPSAQGIMLTNLVAADFNNDGKIDIAASGGPGDIAYKINIFLNQTPTPTTGDPVFATPYLVGNTGQIYNNMVAGDMNLDGYQDIVTTNSDNGGGSYMILTNNGAGQFPNQQVFLGFDRKHNSADGLGIADFNNDGMPDVSCGMRWTGLESTPKLSRDVWGGAGLSINNTFQPLGLANGNFPPATTGVPYSYQIQFTGGNSSLPYQVSLSPNGNNLPAGLTLSPSGLISGTPTQSGAFQPLFNITQSNGQRGSALAYLNVNSATQSSISPGSLPNGVPGIPFNQQFSTNNGPAVWGITQGNLPTGMTLSQNGVLSGTPTVLGQYNFQITATGAGYQSSVSYALIVQSVAAPVVTNLARYGYHAQPTTLVASFSQPIDAAAASNVANYMLTSAGADGRFGTRDDKKIALAAASYNASSNSVTLRLVQKNIPLRQLYRLSINGTPTSGLQNPGGVYLGGQGVGAPGTNFTQIFSGKILAGPNLLAKTIAKKK